MNDDRDVEDGGPDSVVKLSRPSLGDSRRSANRVILAGVMIAALIAGGVLWAAFTADNRSPSWTELVPALGEPGTDTPPTFDMPAGDGSIDMISFRKLGEDHQARYWVAQAEPDQLCLFATATETGFTASACTDRTNFMRSGIALGASFVGGVHINAYLAPDGYVAQDLPAGIRGFTPSFAAGTNASERTSFIFEATGVEEPAHMEMGL